VRPDLLGFVVDRALELARLRRENGALRSELGRLRGAHQLMGESPAFQRLLDLVRTVAPTRAPILLQGESGTGKELIARTIHDLSDRPAGPFVAVSCAALPEALVESALFGHERGAGGRGGVRSALERAQRGTLLLDEISDLRADLQARLLRVLEEADRAGDAAARLDVRIIATTSRDLAEDVRHGRFREDLFCRLTIVPVRVPPLRERPEDILLLARHFAARVAREMGKEFTGFDSDALARLQAYTWPGNVRELAHTVERAIILSTGPTIAASAFAFTGPTAPQHPATENGVVIGLQSLSIAEAEAALIERALVVTRNNRTRAAELLGISVRTLRNKLNREQSTAAD
jgi:DNA-binding NtrC family response regulator